jgi:hypothetical protein
MMGGGGFNPQMLAALLQRRQGAPGAPGPGGMKMNPGAGDFSPEMMAERASMPAMVPPGGIDMVAQMRNRGPGRMANGMGQPMGGLMGLGARKV